MSQARMLAVVIVLMLTSIRPAAAAGPELEVLAPQSGQAIKDSAVMVSFTTANIRLVPTNVPVSEAGKRPEANKPGEGHLHFVLDLQPLVIWDRADPYTFRNVPPGQHQLMVELVNNDHSPFSPRVMETIQFRVEGPLSLPQTGAGASPPGVAPALLALSVLTMFAGLCCLRRSSATAPRR